MAATSTSSTQPTRYAALLRGVNVGGNKKVAMADLRLLLTSLGHDEVKTHLQSGNAVFTAAAGAPAADKIAAEIEAALAAELGLASRVLVRTGAQLASTVRDNPFPSAQDEPSKHLVQFLFDGLTGSEASAGSGAASGSGALAAGVIAKINTFDASPFAPEDFRVGDGVIYFRFSPGISDSKLSVAFTKHIAATFGKSADRLEMTGRNWNTVRRLAELTG